MAAAGYIFKAVSSQLSEMDEMDVPDKEWNIFDMAELSTLEVIDELSASSVPTHQSLAAELETIIAREQDWENSDES